MPHSAWAASLATIQYAQSAWAGNFLKTMLWILSFINFILHLNVQKFLGLCSFAPTAILYCVHQANSCP